MKRRNVREAAIRLQPQKTISLPMLKSKLPYLLESVKETLDDSEPVMSAFELKTLLLYKLDGFCGRHFRDCECSED